MSEREFKYRACAANERLVFSDGTDIKTRIVGRRESQMCKETVAIQEICRVLPGRRVTLGDVAYGMSRMINQLLDKDSNMEYHASRQIYTPNLTDPLIRYLPSAQPKTTA